MKGFFSETFFIPQLVFDKNEQFRNCKTNFFRSNGREKVKKFDRKRKFRQLDLQFIMTGKALSSIKINVY